MEERRKEGAYEPTSLAVGIARLQVGLGEVQIRGLHSVSCSKPSADAAQPVQADDQRIVAGELQQLADVDFGTPLHCLIIAGQVHVTEAEMLEAFKLKAEMQ